MGVLSYLGPLVIIPLVTTKDDPFVKFHIKQGLVLLVIEVIVYAISTALWQFWGIYRLIHLVLVIFSIIGIINVIQGKEKELPLLGSFAHSFKI